VSRLMAFAILAVCAVLEAGGDAMVRRGIHSGTLAARMALFLSGAAVLFAYGWLVNRPPWSFGSLLSVYVVLFFVVAQAIGYFVFGDKITLPVLAGGALIVSGGLLIAVWR